MTIRSPENEHRRALHEIARIVNAAAMVRVELADVLAVVGDNPHAELRVRMHSGWIRESMGAFDWRHRLVVVPTLDGDPQHDLAVGGLRRMLIHEEDDDRAEIMAAALLELRRLRDLELGRGVA